MLWTAGVQPPAHDSITGHSGLVLILAVCGSFALAAILAGGGLAMLVPEWQMMIRQILPIVLFVTSMTALVTTLLSQKDRTRAIVRQMTAALAASNERFALAVACSRDGIWDFDVTSGQVWTSPRYKEIYGYDSASPTKHWAFWRSIILPEDYERARNQFNELIAGDRDGIDMIQRYRHKLGHIVHVHSRAMSVRDPDGNVTRVVGVQTDITLAVQLEQQLKSAINVMEDGFGLFDAEDRVVLHNDAFIDAGTRAAIGDPTGHKFEEVLRAFAYRDMPVTDPGFDHEAWIKARLERHRNPPADPIEVQWGDGRWMRISERRTPDGGYVGIWTDVTEIKRIGQRLQDAIDALSDGFALFDAQDRLVICNAAFRDIPSLRTGSDPVGQTMEQILRAFAVSKDTDIETDDPEAWIRRRLARHLNPPDEPMEQVLTDGSTIRITERRTSDGGIVGIWSNVTALKIAERRLEDAIESINEGFTLLDAEGRYVIFNQEVLRLYPISAPSIHIGGNLLDTLRFGAEQGEYPHLDSPEKIEAFIQEWVQRFRDPTPFREEGTFADGRWVTVSHRGTADGGSVNIYTDITAMKARESDLAGINAQLAQQAQALTTLASDLKIARIAADDSNRSKSQFLANMSHELRTPLNGIIGFSEIIASEMFGKVSPPRYQEYAGIIRDAGKHLLALINDILDLSKIEANRMDLSINAVATADLVDRCIHLVAKMAADRGIAIDAHDISSCPVLHIDETQGRQILLNLLSNAVKFTPDKGRVALRVTEDGDAGAIITVEDTGIGMTKAEIKTAMERFGQAESSYSKTARGTGLGLPLAEGLIKLHGGSLTIDSKKGVGTLVTVRLPWHDGLYRHTLTDSAA